MATLTTVITCLAGASAGLAGPSTVQAAPTSVAGPSGFSDTVVASLASPTALAWTPDGRMLVAQDAGQLRVVKGGRLLTTPALNLASRICSGGERGLLGVAVDPDFASNHYIYLYWSHNAHDYCGQEGPDTPVNRVARYTLGGDDRVVAGSEKVLVDHIPSRRTIHNAGDLHFGANGYLYISVGDNGCVLGDATRCGALNTNSRRLDIPLGKILRVTRSGGVPSTNPYVGAAGARRCTLPSGVQPGTGPCTETFASGFRNPFRFAQVPGTNRFYVNDVGQDTWEEIDNLAKGGDYGWNVREGHCATGSLTDCGATRYHNPIHDYSHAATGCASVTGGAFVPEGVWPDPYGGSYLFGDYVCGKIFRLVPKAGGGYSQQAFLTGVSSPVHLAFGPYGSTQALYYLDYNGGSVHRVAYAGANSLPVASFSQRPDGLTVALDGSASYDPDTGDSVTAWHWDFGDGTSSTTSSPRLTHTYPAARTYTATLTVTDSHGTTSAPYTKDVLAGQHAPAISITAPATTARFSVGQQVTISATATDEEDGTLPGSAIRWTVKLRHGTHTHPYAGPVTGSSVTVKYPVPEDLASTQNSHLVATAVATDSTGLSSRASRKLLPRQVTLSFATNPAGGRVEVNGTSRVTPTSLVSWAGYSLQLNAPDQTIGETPYTFRSWSDGGARSHTIITPGSATTYTANFTAN
jgi:glucose/arabinose dehydrogenase